MFIECNKTEQQQQQQQQQQLCLTNSSLHFFILGTSCLYEFHL